MSSAHYIAVDLGGESGRVILGHLAGDRMELEEVHRFPNGAITTDGHLFWDLAKLEMEIFRGVNMAAQRGKPIAGISSDSWGVDYVLLDRDGWPLADPHCYRDARTSQSMERFAKICPLADVYAETGIQLMEINSVFQLEAEQHDDPAAFARAYSFLTIADYFNSRFSGITALDQSLASTTQLYNPVSQAWSQKLIAHLRLKPELFPRIVPCGSVLGPVTAALAKETSLAQTQVIASASHDTGAAVAAVPVRGEGSWAYLSSGTWSLLGAELDAPRITEAARLAGFTNEVGVAGKIRFLKNIAGLWVLQECRRAWKAAGQSFSYAELTRLAEESGPAAAHISLKDSRFLAPGDMPFKIADFCRETCQPVPEGAAQLTRTVLESLALTYAETLQQLEDLTGRRIETLHVVGGGSRNALLNQLTADATGRHVIAGPTEASAIGNILIQALALGHLSSLDHLRQVVAHSFATESYQPGQGFSEKVRTQFQKFKN